MRKLLDNLNPSAVQIDGDNRFFLVQIPDGQIIKVDLERYTEDELDSKMQEFNLDAKGMDLHGFIGPATTEEKVELGFFIYFEGEPIKIVMG